MFIAFKPAFKRVSLCLLVGSLTSVSVPVLAADGTITINGEVKSSTCKAASSTVQLNTVGTLSLAESGDLTGWKLFPITLTGCTPGAKVGAFFDGPPSSIDPASNTLKNTLTEADAATNVNVEIADEGRTKILIGSDLQAVAYKTVPPGGGAVIFNYNAAYLATGLATAGKFKSTLTFTLIYE